MTVGGKDMSVRSLAALLTIASITGAFLFSMATWAGAVNVGPGQRLAQNEARDAEQDRRIAMSDSLVVARLRDFEARFQHFEVVLNGMVLSECLDAEKAFRLTLAGVNCTARLKAAGLRD